MDKGQKLLDHSRPFSFPTAVSDLPSLANPADTSRSLEERARSYLQANCANCHVHSGGGNSLINLEHNVKLDAAKLVDEIPLHDQFGISGARLLVPGAPEKSVLLHRLMLRGRGQMPPLATNRVDHQGTRLIREWIETLQPSQKAQPAE